MTNESKNVLRHLLSQGILNGFSLKRRTKLDTNSLIKALKPLIKDKFVTASDFVFENIIDTIYFAPLARAADLSAELVIE